ncbi:MAG: hypothetical protein GY801_37795 [bacterium]|nr:hypothetical protein [bacterium]
MVYAPSEDWIKSLGKTIVKCHVKDFKPNKNGQGGHPHVLLEIIQFLAHRGAVNTAVPEVRPVTVEGSGGLSLEEKSKRLDLIAQGK